MTSAKAINGSPGSGNSYIIHNFDYEHIRETADYLLSRTDIRPQVGAICGTGFGTVPQNLTDTVIIPYAEIPHFPISTVEGHAGQMVFGYSKGLPVVIMQGRIHYYEGYPLALCAMPVRVLKMIGVKSLIATNAAGGINPDFKIGDLMIVQDHINIMGFAGNGPLLGPNESRFGQRFPVMNCAYDMNLIKEAKMVVKDMGMEKKFHEGVYICLGGPNFETVAEIRFLKAMGVDAVGMSTVHEVVTARHCDMKVFSISLITNLCSIDYDKKENAVHDDIVAVGKSQEVQLREFMYRMLEALHKNIESTENGVH